MRTNDTPQPVQTILRWRGTWFAARLALVTVYLVSGIGHLVGFRAAVAEQAQFGMPAPALMAGLTVSCELIGSLLVLSGSRVWLGAGILGAFTGLGAIIAHPFWTLDGAARFDAMATFLEHAGLVGGLVLAALAAQCAAPRMPTRVG